MVDVKIRFDQNFKNESNLNLLTHLSKLKIYKTKLGFGPTVLMNYHINSKKLLSKIE